MEVVVTSVEMREFDRYAISVLKIPGVVLMENAGKGVADAVQETLSTITGKRILIFCGKGNNAGDGFVAARHLFNRGAFVEVAILSNPSQLKGDALSNFVILRNLLQSREVKERLSVSKWKPPHNRHVLPKPDLIVDALFGTGFKGKVKGRYLSAIKWMNESGIPTVSVDIPSGVDGDTGEVDSVAVKARLTATMGYKKTGLILNEGRDYAGSIQVVDISHPRSLPGKASRNMSLTECEDVRSWLPKRSSQSHKHSVGKVLIVAGSRGYTGAASLTAEAAMRAGAGSTILAVPDSIATVVGRGSKELIIRRMPETDRGALGLTALEPIGELISWANAIVIGPGLTDSEDTTALVRKLIEVAEGPLVLDADALNVIAQETKILEKRTSKECVLTPHMGEFSRLTKRPSRDLSLHRIEAATAFARKFGVTLLLKGAPTIIASQDELPILNSTGNPGMATAGAGDVLAGLVAGLWAQGMSARHAAAGGAYVHGLAGDFARAEFGERSLMAADILDRIPAALRFVEGSSQR